MAKTPSKQDRESSEPGRGSDSIRAYLHEIYRTPLLTKEQEILYGKQVRHMMALQELQHHLANEWGRPPTSAEWAAEANLSQAELEQTRQAGRQAMQKMIAANLRLVVSIAKQYPKRNVELLDLVEAGTVGLKRAVKKFDPARGYQFSSYAYWWIRQAMTQAIAQQSRTIRLPTHIIEKLQKIKTIQRELLQQLNYSAALGEIIQLMRLEPNQIRDYLMMARQPISLNRLLDVILHFGLNDKQTGSQDKIGKRLSLGRERIQQLEQQALEYLRLKTEVREYLSSQLESSAGESWG